MARPIRRRRFQRRPDHRPRSAARSAPEPAAAGRAGLHDLRCRLKPPSEQTSGNPGVRSTTKPWPISHTRHTRRRATSRWRWRPNSTDASRSGSTTSAVPRAGAKGSRWRSAFPTTSMVSCRRVINWVALQSAGNNTGIMQQNGGWLNAAKLALVRKAVASGAMPTTASRTASSAATRTGRVLRDERADLAITH